MKLWIVILILGAAGCGWLFLKARQSEVAATYKKIGGTTKSIKKAAKKATGYTGAPPIKPTVVEKAEQPVGMSMDASSQVAKTLEELMEEKRR